MVKPRLLLPVFHLLGGRETTEVQCRLGQGSTILVDHGQHPVLEFDGLVVVSLAVLVVIQGFPSTAYRPTQFLIFEQLPVEFSHHQCCGADCHRIAHGHHRLHASLQHLTAHSGFSIFSQLGRLAGIEYSYGYAVLQKQVGNLLSLDRIGLIGFRGLEKQEGLVALIGRIICTSITSLEEDASLSRALHQLLVACQ